MMRHSKSALFLMELIMGILFFALASALCLQLFAKAKMINEASAQKDQAMRIASKLIELYKHDEENEQFSQKIMYYDEQGEKSNQKDAYYQAEVLIEDNQITIEVSVKEEVLYTLDYYHYQQRKWSDEK